jgi:molybdopterin-guanine dinucleotide biosynthesis protein A
MDAPATRPPEPAAITGLVLAGGAGSRMGGMDKGLLPWRGQPLALQALQRLRPQVGRVAVSANRNLDRYRAWGVPAWPDGLPGHAGPLAGWLAAMRLCATPWLASVPCDTPGFPDDLVHRLAAAVAGGGKIAVARTPPRLQPVFALMHCSLADSLEQYLLHGERKVLQWLALHPHAEVLFDDEAAFRNLNTAQEMSGG